MALVSSSRQLWDAFKVLNVYPNSRHSTCVGVNKQGRRCGWNFTSEEQFSNDQLANAHEQLKYMSTIHPLDVAPADLRSLAQNTLCRHFHQGQAFVVEMEWQAKIENFVREHGELLEMRNAAEQRQVDTAENNANGIETLRKDFEASMTRGSELTEKTNKLEEIQAASSRDLALLRKQMTELERLHTNAKNRDELLKMRESLLSEMQGLKDSKARLDKMTTTNTLDIASLKAEVRDRDHALDEKAKRGEEDIQDLRRQLDSSSCEIQLLKKAKASLEEKANQSEKEAEILRHWFQKSDARHVALETRSSEDSKQFGEQLDALEQKHDEGRDGNAAQIERVRKEHEVKIEELGKQLEVVKRELTKREEHDEQLTKGVHVIKQDSAEQGQRVEQLVKQMEGLRLKMTKREEHDERLTNDLDIMRQDSAERDRHVSELVKQMETARQQDNDERDRLVQQLVEQMALLKREVLVEREVRRTLPSFLYKHR